MSLESMRSRLAVRGGPAQQDRMIKDKLKSMLSAIKYSYQAARFTNLDSGLEFRGLFNPVTHTENYDTKMISAEFENGIKVGSYFRWENTQTNWIVFMTDRTELAYFRGEARLCNHVIKWVDGDRKVNEALASIIGPSVVSLETSSSTVTKVSQDFPNGNIAILLQDNDVNRRFFARYQTFLIDGITYHIEEVDRISMPGVIQLHATEHYSNLIEDDVEENVRNSWNVQPIVPEHLTEFAIEGPDSIRPQIDTVFETMMRGGTWVICENEGVKKAVNLNPARILGDIDRPQVVVHWNSLKSGLFTLGYKMPSGQLYQKAVYVESLF